VCKECPSCNQVPPTQESNDNHSQNYSVQQGRDNTDVASSLVSLSTSPPLAFQLSLNWFSARSRCIASRGSNNSCFPSAFRVSGASVVCSRCRVLDVEQEADLPSPSSVGKCQRVPSSMPDPEVGGAVGCVLPGAIFYTVTELRSPPFLPR